ncbi:amino acid transporter [Aspergillus aculeatinus CBS 121060]|uniref:Amino acid transporter n=1 Tax=Aspergillus aculeatinus CBS 121060 TaxID=1448322 RepID=A0ACD1H4F0_9EURO|nr:amino acid transporter [Aspergillus aculeatinus CBS 121060]RAH68334.1 amino acid transporter [Aspergillus aculeatinus CBS 121060]
MLNLNTNDASDPSVIGSVVDIPRKFNLLSVFAIGYSICTAPSALILSLGVIIGSGGQTTLIWGQVAIYLVSLCMACCLAELSSAYPSAGGQYYWAAVLAPKSWSKASAFVIGHLSWASAVCACASMLVSLAEMVSAMYGIRHGYIELPAWVNFVIYQAINLIMFVFNCREDILPALSRFWLAVSLAASFICFVSMLARAPVKQPATFIFIDFTNLTGWPDSISFLTGLLGVNWGFSCLDAVTHMAEEIPNPRENIPKALIGTVIINAVLSWPMAIAVLCCIQNIKDVSNSSIGLSSLSLFMQIFEGRTAGPIMLQCMLFLGGLGAVFSIQTWQSRLAWSIARDNGLIFAQYTKRIAPAPYETPFWSHVYSSIFVALLGCLYLGSSLAFNAFSGCLIQLQYICYSFCIVCLLARGRDSIPHGPFWLGRFGYVCNIVAVLWTLFALIFYSFPPYKDVTPSTMNYTSIVLVAFLALAVAFYLVSGRKKFRPPTESMGRELNLAPVT